MLDTDIMIPTGLKIPFEKSVIVFGNLLDNAIEAAAVSDGKFIFVKLNVINGALYLQIKNSTKNFDTIQRTTKTDNLCHGFGLQNIRLVVENFNGTMKTEQENGIFCITLVLYGV